MDQNNTAKFIFGCQLEISGQSTMNNDNIPQSTVGIVSTLPVYLTENVNRDKYDMNNH